MTVDIQRITRTRSDTYPFTVTFRDGTGELVDLTGASFILTVNAEEDPTVPEEAEFTLVGVIDAPLTGVVEFTMSESDANRFGLFYYDIQMTDVQGYIRTMMRGPFEIHQDITKNEPYLWTAEGKSTVDGSDGIFYLKRHINDTFEYSTRDGTPILRVIFSDADVTTFRYMVPDFPRLDITRDLRLSGLFYMDESWYAQITMTSTGFVSYHSLLIENEPGYRDIFVGGHWAMADQVIDYEWSSSGQLPLVVGWCQWVFEWDAATYKWNGRIWQPPADDPVTPQFETEDGEEKITYPGSSPLALDIGLSTFGVANAEIAWLKLEYI